MTSKGFVVAMRAQVWPAPYDRPFLRASQSHSEWLIVARWGARGEYLTVGEAGPAEAAEAAPIGLQPRRTLFGLLAEEEPKRGASLFLLLRALPEAVPVAGAFAPAEGFARLRRTPGGGLRLAAIGRDVANGAPGAVAPGGACAWAMRAERRPWTGELLDDGGCSRPLQCGDGG
jgi:hypothetical protein